MGKTKTIDINNIPFRIEFASPEVVAERFTDGIDDGKVYFGITDYIKQDILIRSDLGKVVARQTLIHELTHAFLFGLGVSVIGEEQVCEFIGAHADNLVRLANIVMEACYDDEEAEAE